jgi:hypothetical protein
MAVEPPVNGGNVIHLLTDGASTPIPWAALVIHRSASAPLASLQPLQLLFGLRFGRIRMGGPDVNLAAFADCPTIWRFLQRVRFNPERERVSFEHDGILRLMSPHREAEIRM